MVVYNLKNQVILFITNKKDMKIKEILIIYFIPILILSCVNERIEDTESEPSTQTISVDSRLNLKKDFSSALVKVISENKNVRALIKQEALKKFDFDYDVLYPLIKDIKLDNGKSLEELLAQYLTKEELGNINKQIPTLTIFVPSLPEQVFSAESWDIENESPAIGVEISKNNEVLIYFPTGEKDTIPITLVPGFPVLVVKENERVIVNNSNISSKSNTILTKGIASPRLEFLDKTFNNLYNDVETKGRRPPTEPIDPMTYLPNNLKKVIEAYNLYQNTSGWQRDYIYYNISPTSDKGPFDYNYKEYIVGFELLGNAIGAYNKISDQNSDPKYTTIEGATQDPGTLIKWTDGEFEFKVKVYYGSKSGSGSEFSTFFRLKPEELFYADRIEAGYIRGKNGLIRLYKFKELTLKRARLSIPLFEWNLESYSSNIRIAIEEVDGIETIVQTTTTANEFATNFGFDATLGEAVKIGPKFGASQKRTETVSYQVSKTLGNDELGEVIINFADPIITNNDLEEYVTWINSHENIIHAEPKSYNTKYSTGWYRIYISPKKTIDD